jgi:predicted mannosyl-3-phosphoglycerate phosphatase (HAD superfamily)
MMVMGEPAVRVLLFSDLFGSFVDGSGSYEVCAESYRALKAAGVEVCFITEAPLASARELLKNLEPAAPVIADNGRTAFAPPGSMLASSDKFLRGPAETSDQLTAAQLVIAEYARGGDIVLSFGVGDGPDDAFLAATDLAALIPFAEGKVCPAIPRPGSVYECRRPGREGWNEWAEQMLRKVKIELVRDP